MNLQNVALKNEKRRSSLRGLCVLGAESRRLGQDLEKVQQLESKISSELEVQRQQLITMETELRTYGDMDTLRRTADDKKKVNTANMCHRDIVRF